mmetsp:Transcript_10047/g.25014  ORF Transcript_10047/g.25014 Transcript_10047/m.25014 type:complete len:368 (+) Transcript_10047:451-1554(+)
MEGGELLGLLQTVALHDELVRRRHVALLGELALDQLAQVGLVRDAVQHGRRGEAQGHVLQPGLAQRVGGLGEVEQVVDDLEGEAEVVAELLGGDDHVAVERVVAQQGGRLARVGHERGGLAVRLGQVVLKREALLLARLELHELALHQRLEGLGHLAHHLRAPQLGERHRGAREEEVAREHRRLVGVLLVHGEAAAAGVGRVQDVVVNERRRVDDLGDRCEPPLPIRVRLEHLLRSAGDLRRTPHEQHDDRAHALALARVARAEEVLGGVRQALVLRLQLRAHLQAQRRELLLDERKRVDVRGSILRDLVASVVPEVDRGELAHHVRRVRVLDDLHVRKLVVLSGYRTAPHRIAQHHRRHRGARRRP